MNISTDYRICFLHIGEHLAKPHSVSLMQLKTHLYNQALGQYIIGNSYSQEFIIESMMLLKRRNYTF